MTIEEMEKLAWQSAIGHYLSDFPDEKTPEEILELIENNDDSIVFWEPFEYWDHHSILNLITTMQYSLLCDYKIVAGITSEN